jgi:phage FluMu protein gp41
MSYTTLLSGVNTEEKAKHGVGFIIEERTTKNILDIKYISERIITVTLDNNGSKTTYIQIYAP